MASITPLVQKRVKKVTAIIFDGIMPFTQKPPAEVDKEEEQSCPASDTISAYQLFSLFTADIIKKKTVFVR